MLGNQSKWIGALVGYVAGAILSGLAVTGIATCVDPGNIDTCTAFGMSAETVKNIIQAVVTVASVWLFPANKPAAPTA
jgi:hypothetical protein